MFGLDLGEVLILVVALVVFLRPQDMPKLVRKVGKMIGKVKAYWESVKTDIEHIADEDDSNSKRSEKKKDESGR